LTWVGITSGLKPGERRTPKTEVALLAAYRGLFGTGETAEVVLADLANHCGFYAVDAPGTSSDVLQYRAGMRAAYARIFSFLSLPAERLAALETAARAERLADEEELI
jgi:hypothetical protein